MNAFGKIMTKRLELHPRISRRGKETQLMRHTIEKVCEIFPQPVDPSWGLLTSLSEHVDFLAEIGVPPKDALRIVEGVAVMVFDEMTCGEYERPTDSKKLEEAVAALAAGQLQLPAPKPYPDWLD